MKLQLRTILSLLFSIVEAKTLEEMQVVGVRIKDSHANTPTLEVLRRFWATRRDEIYERVSSHNAGSEDAGGSSAES